MTLNMITKLDFFRGNSLISGPLFELFSEPDDNGIHEEFMKISEKNSRQKNSWLHIFYSISVLLQMAKTNGKSLTSDDEAKMRKMVADLGTVHKWAHQIFLYLIKWVPHKIDFCLYTSLSSSFPRNVYIKPISLQSAPPP